MFNNRKEKSLEDTVTNALQRIKNKDYDQELVNRGIAREHIFHYGFGFCGKTVLIGCDKINNDDVNGKEL